MTIIKGFKGLSHLNQLLLISRKKSKNCSEVV